MRLTPLLAAAAALVLMQAGRPAQAGLIGNGTNTVSALFFLGTAVPSPPYTNPPPTETRRYRTDADPGPFSHRRG